MHTLIRLGIALGLALAFTLTASAVEKKAKQVHGTVKSVDKDTLTVEVVKGKKGQQTTTEEKFTLGTETKFERVTKVKGEKGKTETTPASRGDVTAGAKVALLLEGEKVQTVRLHGKNKKK